jgi:hypothetical protein
MSEKKGWLPLIHVYYGPKDDGILRFRATDGEGISKYTAVHVSGAWEEHVSKEFRDYVDPQTLNILRAQGVQVHNLIQHGVGTVWVTTTHVHVAKAVA